MGETRPPQDLFDAVLDIEERFVQEGRDEGLHAASALGILEGAELGWQQGVYMGKEVGFISGQAQVWSWLHASHPQLLSARAASSLQRLQVLLAELKLDAENQELQSSVDAVRAQYKQTYAQIGLGPARKAADKLNF